jgi:hypothetical protein
MRKDESKRSRPPFARRYAQQIRLVLWALVFWGYIANLWAATAVLGIIAFVLEVLLVMEGPVKNDSGS